MANQTPLQYRVIHSTLYEYTDPVLISQHLAHLKPRDTANQRCLSFDLQSTPSPSVFHHHSDYFGNGSTHLAFEGAHRNLVVRATSQVEVEPISQPKPSATPSWETVRSRSEGSQWSEDTLAGEYTFGSTYVTARPEFRDYSLNSFARDRPILDAALDLTARIHTDFKFDTTATNVSTPVLEVFKRRRGVCQDFAHFQIACFRSLGLPARYVSGYLETLPPAGKKKLVGADASHAWVSFWCPGTGWIDVDPTNNCCPSEHHVSLGWGRDYQDIAPLRGILVGGARHKLSVSVDLARLDPFSTS